MFYILNQDNQIVAADYDLLEILEADDLQALFVKVVSGEVTFEKLDNRKVNIQSSSSLIRASHEEYLLKTTFGDLTLVKLYNIIVKSGSNTLMEESFTPRKEESKEIKKDVTPRRASIFLDDEEEKPSLKPKRASIFLDDEDVAPAKAKQVVEDEAPKAKIEDIPNEKVLEDLEVASKKIQETKVDKKPILETLRMEDEASELPTPSKEEVTLESVFEEKPVVAKESKDERELSLEEDTALVDEAALGLEEPTEELKLEEDDFENDLKLAGIDLEEREEDEASIDELLALADEQEKEKSLNQVKEEEPTLAFEEDEVEEELVLEEPKEEEPTLTFEEEETPQEELALDESELEDDLKLAGIGLDDEQEPTLTLEEEPKEEETPIDEGLLISDDEEVEEIGSLLLGDDEAPIEETPKEEAKVEEVGEFDDLLLLDDEAPKKEILEETPKVEEEVEEFDDLLLLDDEAPKQEVVKEAPKVEEEVEEFDDLLLLDDEAPKKELFKEEAKVEEEAEDLFLFDDDGSTPAKETPKEEVAEIKDLLSEIDEEPKVEEPKVVKKSVKNYEYPDTIEIDLDEYGEMIGLGAEDYKEFLNEFIDKSIIYDENLRSEDNDARNESLDELYAISQSLQLPHLEEILEDMLERNYLEEELVDIYFDCLAKITTKSKPQEEITTTLSEDTSLFEDAVTEEAKPEPQEEPKEEPKEEAPAVSANGYGVLSFEGIKPIHFDFRLEEAAEDLSLPVDLIEEFVNDFIEQAIEEKETFIKAYAAGDMDTIQKTGHKLKGASSNLRIIPLSETLEEIQHCENPARFEPLLKKYWGQFLSFKLFMENISH